jgi:hypothetical protein
LKYAVTFCTPAPVAKPTLCFRYLWRCDMSTWSKCCPLKSTALFSIFFGSHFKGLHPRQLPELKA